MFGLREASGNHPPAIHRGLYHPGIMNLKCFVVGFSAALALFAGTPGSLAQAPAQNPTTRVVIMVWDGMRPDFARPELAPNLCTLADRGVRFQNNHSAYITSTEVNGAALATGAFPGINGIVANREYLPRVFPRRPVNTQDLMVIDLNDKLTGGNHVRVKTLPELVRSGGRKTAVATSKKVGFLWDRTLDEGARDGCITLAEGGTIPEGAIDGLVKALGGSMKTLDDHKPGRLSDDLWTTRALTEVLWKDEVPALSVLWMAEPDFSQHQFGPGTPEALAAIRNSDECLGIVVSTLQKKGLLETTNILVVSDHAFSTVSQGFSPVKVAQSAGFDAVDQLPEGKTLAKGQIMISANGGSVCYYVGEKDPETIAKFTKYLQGTDYAGVIFTSTGEPGTFRLGEAFLDAPGAPEILVSMNWSEEKSDNGTPGMVISEGRPRGEGMHATLSPFDTHNTLIAAGPHFRVGVESELPSANIDVAPTVCAILGVKPDPRQTGRVLAEALKGMDSPGLTPSTSTVVSEAGPWKQYLTRTTLGKHTYVDQGGRGTTPKNVGPAPVTSNKPAQDPATAPASK